MADQDSDVLVVVMATVNTPYAAPILLQSPENLESQIPSATRRI